MFTRLFPTNALAQRHPCLFNRAVRSQRYRFCIHLVAEALKSVVYDAPADGLDPSSVGFVNLIKTGSLIWTRSKQMMPTSPTNYSGAHGLHDVGWMRIRYQAVMVRKYYYLRNNFGSEGATRRLDHGMSRNRNFNTATYRPWIATNYTAFREACPLRCLSS